MYVDICTATLIFAYTDIQYMYIYIRTYIHAFMHTYIHTYIYTYVYICMHMCMGYVNNGIRLL